MNRWILVLNLVFFIISLVARIVLTLVKLDIRHSQAPILKSGMKEKYFKNLSLVFVLFIVMGYMKINMVKYKPIWGNFRILLPKQ